MQVDLSFIQPGQHFPPWEERVRLNRYRTNHFLYEGEHAHVFNRWQATEGVEALNVVANWHRRLTHLWADMLFGQPPEVNASNQDAWSRFARSNDLNSVLHESAIDVSRYGDSILKLRYDNGPIIEAVPPHIWFPVVNPANIKEIQYHVLAWKWMTDPSQQYYDRLSVEIHERGRITYRTYILASDEAIHSVIEEESENTGTDRFLVIPISNVTHSTDIHGTDDYQDINPIMEELEMRLTQISRVLDQHADPKMYGDESAIYYDDIRGEWLVRGGGKFFPVSEEGHPPGYITWDARLDAAFNHLDQLMKQFYVLTNTSPAAFGQLEQGLAESGSALRRLIMTTIIKLNRLKSRYDRGFYVLNDVLNEMMAANNVSRPGDIEVQWRDALPEDLTEQTTAVNSRYETGTISLESALRKLDSLEGGNLEEEMNRIGQQSNQQEV